MTGVMTAWITGALIVTYTQGFGKQPPQFPPPYVFLDLSVFMAITAGVAKMNPTVGGLMAWGSLLALMLRTYTSGGQQTSVMTDLAKFIISLSRGGQGGTPGGTQPSTPTPGLPQGLAVSPQSASTNPNAPGGVLGPWTISVPPSTGALGTPSQRTVTPPGVPNPGGGP